MPTVDIYLKGKKIDFREFRKEFMIVTERSGDRIRWETDEETASKKGGVILIWIRAAMRPPEIHLVPVGWKLIVDGTLLIGDETDSASRLEIPITGKTAELQHNDLSFVIRFPVR